MNDAMDSTQMDDIPAVDGQSEQDLLDAVLGNSEFLQNENVPLPDEEETFDDPDESGGQDPEVPEEAVSEEEEESEEEASEEEGEDDSSTQEPDVYTADDLDLDAKVSVKIDGEETEVSFGDLLKGYQTDAHLSKKGRELGEAQKTLDAERAEKLGELDKVATASAAIMQGAEEGFAKEYHEVEAAIKKARDDGDTYELGELKDKREQVQAKYWGARKQREGMLEAVDKHKAEQAEASMAESLKHFSETIPSLIPDFDDKVATSIREFALEEGIAEGLLDSVVDPVIVKFIDDYRRLKQGVSKGAAKRKAVATKKALPTKKAPPASKKKADKEKMQKARAFKEGASADDQMDFLRSYASKSLNL